MWEIKHSNIISARETTISTPSRAYSREGKRKKNKKKNEADPHVSVLFCIIYTRKSWEVSLERLKQLQPSVQSNVIAP